MLGISYTSKPPVDEGILAGLTRTDPPSLRSMVWDFTKNRVSYDPNPEISGEVDRVYIYWFEGIK